VAAELVLVEMEDMVFELIKRVAKERQRLFFETILFLFSPWLFWLCFWKTEKERSVKNTKKTRSGSGNSGQ
jgi:hypothetical protein